MNSSPDAPTCSAAASTVPKLSHDAYWIAVDSALGKPPGEWDETLPLVGHEQQDEKGDAVDGPQQVD
jgi:hypothetical protein